MTVSSTINKSGPYNGNGVTTAFEYEFRILDETHLIVVKTVDSIETILSLADYTVTGVGAQAGGSIVLSVAPPSGSAITIVPNPPFTQQVDLENQGAYYAETIERAFDLAAMRDQKLAGELSRTIQIPVSASAEDLASLIADIVRLGDSADAVDAVAGVAGEVAAVAGNIANINAVLGLEDEILGMPALVQAAVSAAAGVNLPPILPGDVGKQLSVKADATGFELTSKRERLTADRTYYVRTDGSGSNSGLANTAGGAFLTGAQALSAAASIDLNGYTVTIQFGSGTFSGQLVIPRLVGQSAVGSLIINGAGAATILTSNSVFRGTVTALTGAMATVKNATIINTNANGFGIQAAEGGVIRTEAGLTFGATGIACIGSQAQGIVTVTAAFTVTTNTQYILRASDSATIQVSGSGTIALGTRTVVSTVAVFDLGRVTFQSLTWSGTVTGQRYEASGNGVIQTYGAGPNAFPGSVAGPELTGGRYA